MRWMCGCEARGRPWVGPSGLAISRCVQRTAHVSGDLRMLAHGSSGRQDSGTVLSVSDLTIDFVSPDSRTRAVDGFSCEVRAGETLGVVGESGSGKTVTFLSFLGLLSQPAGRVRSGTAFFQDRDLLEMPPADLRALCGKEIGMVFQDPTTSLNPVFSIGSQFVEALRIHQPGISRREARARAVEVLTHVGVPDAKDRVDQFPHQFSGGMRQRAMIAMAIANHPQLIIADEPTTALDVTIQAQVLRLLSSLRGENGAAMVLITHDLGVVAEQADRVVVMYAGRVMEVAPIRDLFEQPRHPYTLGLMASIPRFEGHENRLRSMPGVAPVLHGRARGCVFRDRCPIGRERSRCREEIPPLIQVAPERWSSCHYHEELTGAGITWFPIPPASETTLISAAAQAGPVLNAPVAMLKVESLVKHFPIHRGLLRRVVGRVRAVDNVSFSLHEGETLGLVGESGSGKSTVGRLIMGFLHPTSGRVLFRGEDVSSRSDRQLRPIRRQVQMVFQDPYASLNPRMTVRDVIAEPLRIHHFDKSLIGTRVAELVELVGLGSTQMDRYAHEFSGGQRQRIAIARALALKPSLMILDEPVSSLDVSIQAQVISLLQDLQEELGIAYIFISHDLSVVRHISHQVVVMYLGKIMETGTRDQLFGKPTHPYTQALLSAVPVPDPVARDRKRAIVLTGEMPSPLRPPSGCRFRTRCWKAQDICAAEVPALVDRRSTGHPDACHFSSTDPWVA